MRLKKVIKAVHIQIYKALQSNTLKLYLAQNIICT